MSYHANVAMVLHLFLALFATGDENIDMSRGFAVDIKSVQFGEIRCQLERKIVQAFGAGRW